MVSIWGVVEWRWSAFGRCKRLNSGLLYTDSGE